jgi:hypothetical protein
VRGLGGGCECDGRGRWRVSVCLAGMRMGWGEVREVEILKIKEKNGWKKRI